jgi:hypothetical protein
MSKRLVSILILLVLLIRAIPLVLDIKPTEAIGEPSLIGDDNLDQIHATMGGMAGAAFTMPSMKGMTVNAWSAEAYNSSDFDQSIENLANIEANWVTFTVFWFMEHYNDTEMHRRPDLYTASDSSLVHAIQKAHDLGMKVALKPMVDVVDGTWRGQIAPASWTLWFQNYRNFINYYADFSMVNNVELFTVGTELKSSQSYESQWRQVISQVRTRFSQNITYAANWDSYSTSNVKFWDALDYVGVDAYFPLTNLYSPTVQQLISAWSNCTASGWWGTGRNWTNELYSTYTQTTKKIVFTEIGYYSQDGTNIQPWTGFSPPHEIDLQEQADCYQAALENFRNRTWFMGWFWWNWETDPNAGGPTDNWYPLQNKPAQDILNQYYSVGLNTPPVVENLQISPSNPLTTDSLVGSYEYSDADGDPENGTEIRWYKNAVLQPQLNNTLTASSALTMRGEVWYFTVRPKDGKDFGTLETSPSVTIQNSPPKIDSFTPIGTSPEVEEGENLQFTQTSSDQDNDSLTYSWLLDSVQNESAQNWTYSLGHSNIGVHNVTLVVSDGALEASQEWRVTVKASGGTCTLYIDPHEVFKTPSEVGTTFQVAVTLENFTSLAGFDIKLTWNGTLITETGVDYITYLNALWGTGKWSVVFEQESAGYYELAVAALGTSASNTGASVLFKITFHVDRSCNFPLSTPIHFDVVKLSDNAQPVPNPIYAEVTDGMYYMSAPSLQASRPIAKSLGKIFSVNITVEDVVDLYDFEFWLYYDTTLLDIWNPYVQLGPLMSGASIYIQEWDDLGGYVHFAAKLTSPAPPVSGSGTVAIVTFKATAASIWPDPNLECTLDLINTKLKTDGGIEILHYEVDGSYSYTPLIGDLNSDGTVDLDDIYIISLAYGSEPGDPGWNRIADLNRDNTVDVLDLQTAARHYGEDC